MKNDFFDLLRFWHLSKKTMVENWINILGITIAAIVLMLIFFQFKPIEFINVQATTIEILVISSSIISSILLNKFNNKSKSIDYLLFPVSSFEKILVVLVIVIIFHICTFLVFHEIFAYLYVDIYTEEFNKNNLSVLPEKISILNSFYFPIYGIIIFYQSFITMGSLIFKRNSYFKSLITLIIAWFLIFCINWIITYFLFENSSFSSIPFTNISIKNNKTGLDFRIDNGDFTYIKILFQYFLPTIFIIISYFKLKEKEV